MPFEKQKISNKKSYIKIWITLLLIILIGGAGFLVNEKQYRESLSTTSSNDDRLFPFEIEKGENPISVAEKLKNNDFVNSKKYFLKYAKSKDLDQKFQAGKFFLPKNLTIPEIADKLTHAFAEQITITFPEGFTLEDIDARLTRIGLIEENQFIECIEKSCDFTDFDFLPEDRSKLEGYFFPATYNVTPQNFDTENFAKEMLKAFQARIKNLEKETQNSGRNLEEIVIMASILEKETRTSEERPMVADIFWRRFDAGIPIGADATVRYFTGKKTEDITIDDLQNDNPFNTRKNRGLPPHAICNPGMESLEATVLPKANDFWYFLHDNEGNIYYAKTLDEHNKNKYNHLR